MKDIKIFEELANCKGYDIALITTFNFDINFFERCLLSRLYENGIRKISLFNDSKELNQAISNVKYSSIGKKYMVNPIEMNGAFHPKIVLLLGMNKAKLFVSSANITSNGYYNNNEVFNCIEYDADNLKGLKVIKEAISFFEKLNELSYKQDTRLFNEIKSLVYYNANSENHECRLIHNLEENILEQLAREMKNVKQIDVAVPYYDNELNAINQIKNIYPEAKINLYLQNKKCKFNKEKNISDYNINIYNGFYEIGTNNFYHGKVFRFITDQESYILYGSANCTESALLKTIKSHGNIECDILEKGLIDEFDYFFENFKLEAEVELSCDLISYKKEIKENYYYKYGKVFSDLKLYLGYKEKIDEIIIKQDSKELEYKYTENNEIEISIPMEEAITLSDIFEIEIYYNDCIDKINCWFINEEALEINRNSESKEQLSNFELDAKDDKYLEDRISLIRAMNITYEEYLKEIENRKLIFNDNTEKTEENEDDDGIINYIVPSIEDIEIYHKNQMVYKIKNAYLQRYLNIRFNNDKTNKNVVNISVQENNAEKLARKPTTNELSFRRFIRSRANEMIKAISFENVDIESYFSSVLVFYEIFDKYTLKENVEGLFDIENVIDVKKQLLLNLLEFQTNQAVEKIKKAIIILAIETILKNRYINKGTIENYKLDNKNKEILLKTNQLFDIRKEMDEYLKIAIDSINEETKVNLNFEVEKMYVDNLFGYKTEDQILNLIYKEYGSGSQIDYKNEIMEIAGYTDSITKYLILNQNIIGEIVKHYKNYNKELNKIIIRMDNTKEDYSPTADPIKNIVFDINVSGKNYTKKIERKSGKMDDTEYNRLQYI